MTGRRSNEGRGRTYVCVHSRENLTGRSAGGLGEVVVIGSKRPLVDGRRDAMEEKREVVDCLSRGVVAVAKALVIRATAEGEARSPECEPFAIATKIPRTSSKTLSGRPSAVIVVGSDRMEENLVEGDSVEGKDVFVAFKIDISVK